MKGLQDKNIFNLDYFFICFYNKTSITTNDLSKN